MVKAFVATLAGVLLVLGLGACGSSNSSPSTTSTPKAGAIHPPAGIAAKVQMTQSNGTYTFTPATISAKSGTAVMWTNKTGVLHSVTFDSGMSGGKDVESGKSASFTFSKAGTYRYHCRFHPYMKGTVKVQ